MVELEVGLSEAPTLSEFTELQHALEEARAQNAALELKVSVLQENLHREKARVRGLWKMSC